MTVPRLAQHRFRAPSVQIPPNFLSGHGLEISRSRRPSGAESISCDASLSHRPRPVRRCNDSLIALSHSHYSSLRKSSPLYTRGES